jgi:hypothetical protein
MPFHHFPQVEDNALQQDYVNETPQKVGNLGFLRVDLVYNGPRGKTQIQNSVKIAPLV